MQILERVYKDAPAPQVVITNLGGAGEREKNETASAKKKGDRKAKKGKMEEHTGFTRENKHNQLSIYTDSHELRCSIRKKAVDFRLKGKRALKRR